MNSDDALRLRTDIACLTQLLAGLSARLDNALIAAPQPALLPVSVAAPPPVVARQVRCCSYCLRSGHRRDRCPDRQAAEAARIRADADRVLAEATPRIRFRPSVQTDCPVCLENKLCCVLACDHHLCGDCVTAQWTNNLRSCGLCRAALAPK